MLHRILNATLACLIVAACKDSAAPPTRAELPAARAWFESYVAIGTSVSMGWASDGVVAASQLMSWPAQLSRAANREMALPLISAPGCKAPFASPVTSFQRVSGESAAVSDAAVGCSLNEPDVDLPAQNVAIAGALTGDALTRTAETQPNPFLTRLYSRILPPGESQVTAAEKMHPEFASIELGSNDILGTLSGAVIPGVTYVPFAVWSAQYNQVVDRLVVVSTRGILVGLAHDIASLPTLRRGYELWEERAAFLSTFNVGVKADCDASQNLLVVPAVVPLAVANGLGRKAAGAGPYLLSCAEGAGTAQDRILTPAEASVVNAAGAQMNDHIRAKAEAIGYAFFELEALYGLPKPAFNVVDLMTTATPYGPNFSLDGLHPSGAGAGILARAAVQAIDARYQGAITGTR